MLNFRNSHYFFIHLSAFLLCFLNLSSPFLYADTNKLALVIVNSEDNYGVTFNEAKRISQALENLCFEVTLKTALNSQDINAAIDKVAELTELTEIKDEL